MPSKFEAEIEEIILSRARHYISEETYYEEIGKIFEKHSRR